ncbi:hypothetical protein [Glycomyces tritici]|uniref:Aminoglycoside phosphotransferase domain-containing protein n=1 Tax=Glycomyces tritici TaxID=2665176 RepID=A0ABT7YST6_9ACTN|nr:hypothetical protein [Glycomyces tritici]MDN3241702.1 hypothetical protein [Glycomyces tritici]
MPESAPDAVPLEGGRMAAGVVRIGDTVHRPRSGSSDFMAALLGLLERQGFDGAPRHLGRSDEADVLSFLPGEVPARFGVWSDEQVRAAAALLRRMHDATRGSDLAGRCDVVCHHDPGPNNAVFQGGLPVAFIDFAEPPRAARSRTWPTWRGPGPSPRSRPFPLHAKPIRCGSSPTRTAWKPLGGMC